MKSQFNDDEKQLFWELENKKAGIQDKLNILNDKVKEVAQVEAKVRKQVAALKPELVPLSEMQAALANPVSRDKYFAHLSKNDFIQHVRDSLK